MHPQMQTYMCERITCSNKTMSKCCTKHVVNCLCESKRKSLQKPRIHTHTRTRTNTHTRTHTHAQAHAHTRTHTNTHTHMQTRQTKANSPDAMARSPTHSVPHARVNLLTTGSSTLSEFIPMLGTRPPLPGKHGVTRACAKAHTDPDHFRCVLNTKTSSPSSVDVMQLHRQVAHPVAARSTCARPHR